MTADVTPRTARTRLEDTAAWAGRIDRSLLEATDVSIEGWQSLEQILSGKVGDMGDRWFVTASCRTPSGATLQVKGQGGTLEDACARAIELLAKAGVVVP